MATARDRALNLNVPLRAQIAELKKNLVTEAEALKSSQDGRDQDRAKHMQKLAKKEGEITGLLHQAKKTASDSDQFKKSQQKKAEQLMADLSATQSALALKTTELESTVFDANRVQSELEQVREQSKQLDTGRAEREAVVANLRKQLEEAKSRLLSSRTNQQVEEDRIRKAVQGATATRDERIKVLKEKNDELEEKFANVAAVHEALEQEIAEGQAKIKLLEDQLSSSRAAIERDSNLA
jgi:chromosome segregation ATPase